MKTSILIVALLVPVISMGCPTGSSEWKDGCVVDLQPETAKPVQPSDEKPPSDKMPSYEREGVTTLSNPNLADEDAKLDADKQAADKEGKHAAGLDDQIIGKKPRGGQVSE